MLTLPSRSSLHGVWVTDKRPQFKGTYGRIAYYDAFTTPCLNYNYAHSSLCECEGTRVRVVPAYWVVWERSSRNPKHNGPRGSRGAGRYKESDLKILPVKPKPWFRHSINSPNVQQALYQLNSETGLFEWRIDPKVPDKGYYLVVEVTDLYLER